MRVIKEGVWYEIDCTDKSNQKIVFIHKNLDTGEMVPGTTTEEVIACLINRLETLNKKVGSFENVSAIRNLNAALYDVSQRSKNKSQKKLKYKEQNKDFDVVLHKVSGTSLIDDFLTIEEKGKENEDKW